MTAPRHIKVEGLRELGLALKGMGAAGSKAAGRATGAAARLVRSAAKANLRASPSVDTGTLVGAVIAKKLPKGKTALTSEHVVTVRGRGKLQTAKGKKIDVAPHGSKVEFGTVNMPAEPFLRPAMANNIAPAIDAMAGSLRKDIAKAAATRGAG